MLLIPMQYIDTYTGHKVQACIADICKNGLECEHYYIGDGKMICWRCGHESGIRATVITIGEHGSGLWTTEEFEKRFKQ